MQVEVKGLSAALANLGQIEKEVTQKNAVKRVLRKSLEPMRADIAARAPVDKGNLRDSVAVADQYGYVKVDGKTGEERFARSRYKPTAKNGKLVVKTFLGIDPYFKPNAGDHPLAYAQLIEFGSEAFDVNFGPQPFFRPGWDAGKNALPERCAMN
jgi:HK97 gp10 family phage protein